MKKTCLNCGKNFESSRKKTRYCSLKCGHESRKIPISQRFWGFVERKGEDDCWNWIGGKHNQGYGQITINGKTHKAHRVSWLLIFGPINDDLCVCHKCDNSACVNPNHLFLGTQLENILDRNKKGHSRGKQNQEGELNDHAKLTALQVVKIREMHKEGKTQRELGNTFGVSKAAIGKIVNRQTWRSI